MEGQLCAPHRGSRIKSRPAGRGQFGSRCDDERSHCGIESSELMPAIIASDRWWPGDRLLCISEVSSSPLVPGRLYILRSRNPDGRIEVDEFSQRTDLGGTSFPVSIFRWLRPHIADPQDRWTIELMQGSSVDGDAIADTPAWWGSSHMVEFRETFKALEIGGF